MRRTLSLTLAAGILTSFAAPVVPQDAPATPDTKSKKAAPAKEKAPKPPAMALARLSGSYADLAEGAVDLTAMLMGGAGGKPKPFYDLIGQFRQFAAQKKTDSLLLDLSGGFGMNLVQVNELTRVLKELKKANKKVHAYLENAGSVQMQLAAHCDKVIIADMGSVELPSVSMSIMFMRDALNLLGVEMDVVRCGDFKGAVEPYMLSKMSKHLRAHYKAMLTKMNDDVVRRIADGRGLTFGAVRKLQAQRLITATQAKEAGLVDEIVPWIGAKRALMKVAGTDSMTFDSIIRKKKRKSINFFTLMSNLLNPASKKEKDIEAGLVVLHLSGGIVDGTSEQPGSIVSGPTVANIRRIAKDDGVKAVVVRINSPGGSATASEAILLALKDLAKKKTVVFSMGRVAASGGYYVTCLGRPIFAEAGTITGSIGVFGMRPVMGALMRRVGLHEEIVGLDEGASMMSMSEGWSAEHKAVIQKHINNVYDRFTGHVAASRSKSVHEVLKIAGGRVWSGEQAREIGLVDEIGGLDAAKALAAKEAGLNENYETTHLPEPADPMSALMKNLVGVRASLPETALQLLAKRSKSLEQALQIFVDALTNPRPTHVWMMMPEGLEIR